MSNQLRDLRLSHSLAAKDMAETVRELYPKFDRYLLSKCEASDAYGIDLRKDALKALYMAYAPDKWSAQQRRSDGHKNQRRIMCRMDDTTYAKLMTKIRQDGFKTVQDWLMDQVTAYISACL